MENLTITAICQANSNTLNELAQLVSKHNCQIQYSHLYTLGADHTITIQVIGNWSGIAKIESALSGLTKRLNIELVCKRSHLEKITQHYLPYRLDIIAAATERPNLVFEISEFCNFLEIPIRQWETISTMYQQTSVMKFAIQIDLPTDQGIADIREQFLILCDELNIDGTMEPDKV